MIKEYVNRFIENKNKLKDMFKENPPDDYSDIVKATIEIIRDDGKYDDIDPNRIHVIDDGDYQGTLVFVIAACGYQPHKYWYTMVDYGSCSGCDTLQAITEYSSDLSDKQLDELVTLALHIVQELKPMGVTYD